MNTQKVLFLLIGIIAIGGMVVLFRLFIKRLGKLGGDFKVLADNFRILLPMVTMLIFAVMVAVLLFAYQAIWHDLFNL
ncbi:MAG: hypothetical protein RL708_2357 [Bacteroidota bacterium]|jgi:uncharacterized membrane protein